MPHLGDDILRDFVLIYVLVSLNETLHYTNEKVLKKS